MKLRVRAAIAGIGLVCASNTGIALAQTGPNFGNYQSLDGLFRIGVQVQTLGVTREQGFEQDTFEDIGDYLDPFELQAFLGPFYTNQSAVSAAFDLRGAPAFGGYAANSSVLSIRFANPDGTTLVLKDGTTCQFTYNGLTRQQSYNQLDADTEDFAIGQGPAIGRCLTRSFARSSAIDPLAGNPFSLQSSIARSALDLTNGDSLIERDDGANTAGDPWIVGASYSTGNANRFDMTRIDARIARGFRVFEGNRALLKFDMPFSFSRVRGAEAYAAQIGLGLEVPVIAQRWSLEPRVAYGVTYSGTQGSLGHIAQGSVTSRFLINGVGRGRFIIGNMVGYSSTLATPGDFQLNPDIQSVVTRNGFAYELPIKLRAGGRNASVRASYNFTKYFGPKLYNNSFHEATISFGVRGREETARAARDLIRINFNTIQASGFSSYTAGLGFRF